MAVKPFVKTSQLQQSQPIVDKDGRPAAWFVRLLNDNNANVTNAINVLAQIPEIQTALKNLDSATKAAQSAADAAQQAADNTKKEAALQGSYIEPSSVLTATPTTITIASHTRYYPQTTGAPISVSVNGGTVAATTGGDTDYIFYSDPMRAGGNVTYQVSTEAPVQTGNTHVVGAVLVPTTGTADGGEGPRRPGYVTAKFDTQPAV